MAAAAVDIEEKTSENAARADAEYVREISDLALVATNRLCLNAIEADLIYQWREQGIPLPLILRSMSELIAYAARNKRKIWSLCYFTEEIEASFGEYRELMVGR